MNTTPNAGKKLRPCLVYGLRAMLHCFFVSAHVRDALLVGETPGQVSRILALVEYEDGKMDIVGPGAIKMLDSNEVFSEYDWDKMEQETGR